MRITEIEINNFRAFYGKHTIKLDNDGKNLVLFGENGSGKSSFFLALKTFFESSQNAVDLQKMENIFVSPAQKDSCYLQIKIKEEDRSSSVTTIKVDVQNNIIQGRERAIIADANKIKGFFDYKSLLKTYLVEKDVNIFDIIIQDILAEQVNRFSNKTFISEWDNANHLCNDFKQGVRVKRQIASILSLFNDGLKAKIREIESDTNMFIEKFGYNITVELIFDGVEYVGRRNIDKKNIFIKINFLSKEIPNYQLFLNEAKLSALAISLYLASIKSNPSVGVLKTIVLDDLLIGLDMSNRIPLLNILKDFFEEEFQLVLTTYDRIWYEIVKNFFGESKWKYIEIYSNKLVDQDFDIPIVRQDNDYIQKAEEYFNIHDYKASAVYVRSEFEKLIKDFCETKGLQVKYNSREKKLSTEDFWKSIKTQTNIDDALVQEVEMCRGTVMNPFSHHDLSQPQFKAELQKSIDVVKKIKYPNFNKDNNRTIEKLEQKIANLERQINHKDGLLSHLRGLVNTNP